MAFDAAQAAAARGADVLMVDTAGRLRAQSNLMEELSKVHRVLVNQLGRPLDEVLLVMDATTRPNGLSQARLFSEAVPVSGIALTKLDGTAEGGIIVAIAEELELPVKLVGVGEQLEDLQDFDRRRSPRRCSLDSAEPLFGYTDTCKVSRLNRGARTQGVNFQEGPHEPSLRLLWPAADQEAADLF